MIKLPLKITKKNKQEFFESLKQSYDLLIGYFNLADVIGHLSFRYKGENENSLQRT